MIPARIRRIDSFFDLVSQQLSFSNINPKNIPKKRTQFTKNKKSPRFTYPSPDASLQQYKDMLLEVRLGSSPLERIMERKRKELIAKIDLINAVGHHDFPKRSQKVYPLPDKRLVEQAHALLGLEPSENAKRITRKEGIRLMRRMLNDLGMRYRITSTDMITSARVNTMSRVIELRKRERFSEDYFKRLVVHEIGAHALRTENGRKQPLLLFRNGFAHYLSTEEGIASYNELAAGVMTNSILRNYAGRVLAVDEANRSGFEATYKALRKHFSPKTAWKLALRAKRGLADTGEPGAYTKDAVYLQGLIDVRRFASRHDLDELYIGKVGIRDLPLIRKAGLRLAPVTSSLKTILEKGYVQPSERRLSQEALDELL